MRLVILESPYRGIRDRHLKYLDRAMRHSLGLGEAPFASHRLYTTALDDSNEDDRDLGMRAGWAWLPVAEAVVVYQDHGISDGMLEGLVRAEMAGKPIEYRNIGSFE